MSFLMQSTTVMASAIVSLLLVNTANVSAQELPKKVLNIKKGTDGRQAWFQAKTRAHATSLAVDSNKEKNSPLQSNADFTLPDLGDGAHIIPSPSFNYTNVNSAKKNSGFTGRVWGNSLGVDSSLQKVAAKMLSPQISLLGLSFEETWLLPRSTDNFSLFADVQVNLLYKKVDYFDSSRKPANATANFNPFVLQPRIGLMSFVNQWCFIGAYGNFLSVLTENSQFSSFFNTHGKTNFFFPEVDAGGIFNIDNSGKQQIKFEFDMIFNNGDAQTLYNSHDKVIPFIKVGFVTGL
jgi:hypothetical protein